MTATEASAWVRANSSRLIAATALTAVALGLALAGAGRCTPADWLWAAATAMLLLPPSWSVLRSLLRRDVGVDAIALVERAPRSALVRRGDELVEVPVDEVVADKLVLIRRRGRAGRRDGRQ